MNYGENARHSVPTSDSFGIISLGSLQRLIALHAVSLSTIPAIIQTMNECTMLVLF
jgi:hypothetical protein